MKKILRLCFPKKYLLNRPNKHRWVIWSVINLILIIYMDLQYSWDFFIGLFVLATLLIGIMDIVFNNKRYLHSVARECLRSAKVYCAYMYIVGFIYATIISIIAVIFDSDMRALDYIPQYMWIYIYLFISLPLIVVKRLLQWWIVGTAVIFILNMCLYVLQTGAVNISIQIGITLLSVIMGIVISYVSLKSYSPKP